MRTEHWLTLRGPAKFTKDIFWRKCIHTLIFLKDVKIVPGFGDASYLNFLFLVLSLFWGNRNSIFSFHIYQRHFTSNENAFSNYCFGRAKRGVFLSIIFLQVCFEVTQIGTISENHVLFSSYFKFCAMPGSIVISAFRCK